MSTAQILPPRRVRNPSDYFALLKAARLVSGVIADALTTLSASGAKRLRSCGRYGIGSEPIELIARPSGELFARGVKWCKSRYCPICQPRMMAALGHKRAQRARAAEAAGFGIAFAQFGQPHGFPGELAALVDAQRRDWQTCWPSPSRLPASWRANGLGGWLSMDYNWELDWDAEAEAWHVHGHPVAFSREPFTTEALAFLRSCWLHPEPLAWAELAETPEAAARYSVKAENQKDHILSLFDLAALGMVEQVAEYLSAVDGKRLRAPSLALSKALGLHTAPEDEAGLMASAEAAPGQVVERMTAAEWSRRW